MQDVTDQFEDVNDYDRLYRTPQGILAKVRVEEIGTSASILSFRVTGSWADEGTGKAREFAGGWFIVEPHEIAIMTDSPVDVAALVDDGRELVALRVEAAAVNQLARATIPGVKPKAPSNGPAPGPVVHPLSLEGVQQSIDQERDRRIDGGFTFEGHRFQSRASDRENIMGASQLAMAAIAQGAGPDDLRWANPDQDFVWITADNQLVPLDAHQVVALFQAGVAFKASLTFHARGLKDAAAEAEDLAAFEWRDGWPE